MSRGDAQADDQAQPQDVRGETKTTEPASTR
jgi:hypothetical protein